MDVANEVSIPKVVSRLTASYSMLIVQFRVLCAVRTRLWSRWWFRCTSFCVQLFALRASGHCKHDVGTHLWLIAETVERVPTHPPLWQTCKVLHPWALFRETTVYVKQINFIPGYDALFRKSCTQLDTSYHNTHVHSTHAAKETCI